ESQNRSIHGTIAQRAKSQVWHQIIALAARHALPTQTIAHATGWRSSNIRIRACVLELPDSSCGAAIMTRSIKGLKHMYWFEVSPDRTVKLLTAHHQLRRIALRQRKLLRSS